jgi:hypothetical protein
MLGLLAFPAYQISHSIEPVKWKPDETIIGTYLVEIESNFEKSLRAAAFGKMHGCKCLENRGFLDLGQLRTEAGL